MNWHSHAVDPVALLILPWEHGVTIAKRDRDGSIHGCRDVSHGEHFASIVAAWKADAAANGLPIEDHT